MGKDGKHKPQKKKQEPRKQKAGRRKFGASEMASMRKQLDAIGMELCDVQSDGNCLFRFEAKISPLNCSLATKFLFFSFLSLLLLLFIYFCAFGVLQSRGTPT
jgi:hypothetical protein